MLDYLKLDNSIFNERFFIFSILILFIVVSILILILIVDICLKFLKKEKISSFYKLSFLFYFISIFSIIDSIYFQSKFLSQFDQRLFQKILIPLNSISFYLKSILFLSYTIPIYYLSLTFLAVLLIIEQETLSGLKNYILSFFFFLCIFAFFIFASSCYVFSIFIFYLKTNNTLIFNKIFSNLKIYPIFFQFVSLLFLSMSIMKFIREILITDSIDDLINNCSESCSFLYLTCIFSSVMMILFLSDFFKSSIVDYMLLASKLKT